MTADGATSQPKTLQWTSSVNSSTVQILVANEGNRRAIENMLTDDFQVDTNTSIQNADLYLIEDRLFAKYRDELREKVTQSDPVFCPVVIIRRDKATGIVDWTDSDNSESETPLLIDEFIEAPINRQLLVSRLRSLLVRRQQSLVLLKQVATLERQERDLRRFERAVEDSGTATAITDSGGVIEYVNAEFEALTGYLRSDAVGRSLERFVADESLEIFGESFWPTMAKENEWKGELLIERINDQHRITETTITPIQDTAGEIEGFVVVMPDISQRVSQEQLLRDREQELELLRQILSRYLRHNLRNDLNVIQGYAGLLEATLPEQDAKDAAKILETARRLLERSETARKYSTLIEQEGGWVQHNVSSIVEEAASETRKQYPKVSIEVDTPDECYVLARDGIKEAIRGLIDNAARYNTTDAPSVHITVTEPDGVQILIEDNGPGISDLELATLEQGSETALKHSQGIGLWLSKWVIERGNGRLSFDTVDDGGTRATIDFPSVEEVGTHEVAVSDLKAREQRLKTITQRMTDAILEVDASWKITFVDEQAESILGVDADAIRGQQFWDVFSDARNTRFEAVYREVMQSRSKEILEEYYSGIDGWLEVHVYPDFDGGLSFYFRDITDRKTREQELKQARSRMELALEQTNAAVWEWDLETDAVTMHPERDPVFETELRTLRDFIERIYPNDRAHVKEALETAVETGSPYDVEYRLQADKTVRWAAAYGEVQYDADGDATRMLGIVRDITEQKQREQELRELEQFNRELLENAPVGLFRLDDQMRIIYENERAEEIMGVSENEDESIAIGKDPRELQSVRDAGVVDIFDRLEGGDSVTFELPFESLYGEKRYVTGQAVPLFDNGAFDGGILMLQDITEQREREWLFEAVFNNTYTFTGVMDPDGTLQEANETALSFAGIEREDVIGEPIWESYWFQENQNTRETARKAVTQARRGELFRDEIRVQGKDDVIIIDFSVRPVLDEDGTIRFLIPEGRDITELKKREQQLEAEQRRYQSLVDVLPHGVYRADPETLETTYSNEALEQIHTNTADEGRYNPGLWGESLHPDDASAVVETFQTHRETREPGQLEYRIQTPDGETRWVEDTFRWEYDNSGNVTALVGVYTDITDRKKHDHDREKLIRDLEQSEEKLQLALEAGEMGMWELDLQSEESPIRTFQHDKIFGYEVPVDDWSVDIFLEHVHPADRTRIAESFEEAFETGTLAFECRINRVDGELRWIAARGEFYFDPEGSPDYAIGVVEDITERKEREQALEERIKELTALQTTAHTLLQSDTALDEVFEEFIQKLPQTFQYPAITAGKIEYRDHEAVTADFEPRENRLTAQTDPETGGTVRIDVVYLEERPLEDNGPFLTEEQELLDTLVALIAGYVERWEYIQQLERQKEQLERKTSHLDAILQHTSRPLFMKSTDGKYLLANREYQEQFGLAETDIIGRTDFELHPREMAEEVWANDRKVIQTGEPIEVEERILIHGEERLYLSSKVPIYFTDDHTEPDAVFGMATDITDRTARQEELKRKNKQLEAFTSFVSHDLRNPLNVAQGRLELVKDECQSEHIEHIGDAHHRIETLIEDMLTLARNGDRVGKTEPVMLAELVKACWQTVETADASLLIETDQTILADESRLRQLLENVLRNAIEHGGPTVTVTVGDLDDGFYIEDDGPGIAPENRETVFETEYSSSTDGAGFGLRIVNEIVNGHGWTCRITDGTKGGARIEITDIDSTD